jgi:site-specific DNA-methyltransferase (adenine-specific)
LRGKHPATFPQKLVEDCLKLTGIKSGIVLDPFIGTGTTAVAAKSLGWDFVGFDIDEDYLNFAKNRLENN